MLLLHICCADCGLKLIERIEKELNFDKNEIVLYFYNPNIHPRSELLSRQEAVKKMFGEYKIIIGDWEPKKYFLATSYPTTLKTSFGAGKQRVTSKKQNKNSGNSDEIFCENFINFAQNDVSKRYRCPRCWELRLEETFRMAKEKELEMVSSTLFSSQYQDFDKIKKIGKKLEQEYAIKFWVPGKIDTEKKTSGFYKQNYCGCCYSLVERMEGKFC